MKTIIATAITLASLMAALSAFHQTNLNVFALSAYQSGFNHGTTDGKDSCLHLSGCHWYILEPGKGFAFHSKEFVRGYVNGFCSVDPNTSSDSDHASFDCDKGPDSASWVDKK
jgi:hypothetical protein